MRGDILNSMIPIERNGEILGYIWANELTEDIRRRAGNGCEDYHCAHRRFADKPAVDCPFLPSPERQYRYHHRWPLDSGSKYSHSITTIAGEMGQISQSVNNLARALRETRTLNDLIIENAADGVIAIDRR